MESRRYPTDLSDDEWRCIGPHLPEPTRRGRPRLHGLRAILDAVFYVLKSGCPWRLLPRDFPPWKTVYDWFRRWRIDGTWERLNAELREQGTFGSASWARLLTGEPGGQYAAVRL
jgi:putative transposase